MSHLQTPQPGININKLPSAEPRGTSHLGLSTGKGPNSWEVSLVPQGQLLTPGLLAV